MDADRNGIPCETVYPPDEVEAFLADARIFGSGLSCSALDLPDDPAGYRTAIAYWMLEGTPDRMDADGDGIPCEETFDTTTANSL